MPVQQEMPLQPPQNNTVLSIGVFDGVHAGHRHVLDRLKDTASRNGMLSGVLTFVNHPRTVITPEACVRYITSVEDRLTLLENTGVDLVIPLTFDVGLSRLRAHEFVELLQDRLNMAGLVMGHNFVMGYQREGTSEVLKAICSEKGLSTTVLDPVSKDGERVSSTAIREVISSGDMRKASRFLGRPFALRGKVITGNVRGRTMGFPTANLDIRQDRIIPGNGIYATWAYVDGKRYMASTNVGTRPTFEETERIVEAFILDYSGDLYDSEVTVEFAQRLRDELRFETVEALVAQIHEDVERTRQVLIS
ncbi:MAG: bifunctional riboflavin kinase/FAD synthetase [Dehalococcoidia bacterium]|nr:bifunctional riboflavin kinase/FAD synthetase [Dehalococcoidia bacterium]